MKKAVALLMFGAMVFAFAACAKKGEIYVEPPTEIITFKNGGSAVYEVVTDESGVAQTDADGATVYRPYDPPVTKKGGYMVTDAEGSTIKQSATTGKAETAAYDSDSGALDGTTAAPVTNAKGETVAQQTTANGQALDGKADTTKKGEQTTVPPVKHALMVPCEGELTRQQALKLTQIFDRIENPFDEDVAENKFLEAKESMKVYLENIKTAQKQITDDPVLYSFVTKSNLEYWNYYLTRAQRQYDVFAAVVEAQKPGEKPSSSVYSTYTDFQTEYRQAMEVYYHIYSAAEQYIK
ncbi:MAG TPA: hypothetical protein DDY98_06955 [Ruminococcaceae bacterium]|nr:hypothetical protein [Oscillospiraceae bacterium]